MKVVIDGVEYVPSGTIPPLTDERLAKALVSLTEIQYFSDQKHKHRAWAWDALNALAPDLAAMEPEITLSKIHHDFFHRHIDVGRMLSILVKLRKSEHDLELWRKAYGMNPAILCDRSACLLPQYSAFRAEVIERLRVLELER